MHVKRLYTVAVASVYIPVETAFFKSYLGTFIPWLLYRPNQDKRRLQEVKQKKLDILKKDKRMNETQDITILNETRG